MQIERTLQLPSWDDEMRQKVVAFWTSRGVRFAEASDNRLTGTRGGMLGNLTSFNMKNLSTQIEIEITDSNACTCRYKINTAFQIITKWNAEYWALELDTFESMVCSDDLLTDRWSVYRKRALRNNTLWSITAVLLTATAIFGLITAVNWLAELAHNLLG